MNNKQTLHDEYIKFIYEQNHSLHLTLKFDFNCLSDLTQARMRNTLKAFDARLNRSLLGPKWTQKHPSEHIQWDAFAEKVTTHGHWHLLASVPVEQIRTFTLTAKRAWQELRGTDKTEKGFHCDIIYDNYGLADYVVKELKDSHVNSLEFKAN